MNDYKGKFVLIDSDDDSGVIHSGPWRFFYGPIEQARKCFDAMERHGVRTPQDVKALPAKTRAQFAMNGATLECIG